MKRMEWTHNKIFTYYDRRRQAAFLVAHPYNNNIINRYTW